MANFPSNNAAFPQAGINSRSIFITRTYTHLVAGILGFILVELGLFDPVSRFRSRGSCWASIGCLSWARSC